MHIPGRRVRPALVLVMGCLAIAAVFVARTLAVPLVGLSLLASGVLEMLEVFQAGGETRRRSAYLGGGASVLAGILLLIQPHLALRGLSWLMAGSFAVDGVGKVLAALRTRAAAAPWRPALVAGLVNIALASALVSGWPVSGLTLIVVLVGVRMLSTGWSMLFGPEGETGPAAETPSAGRHPDGRLGLPPHEEFAKLEASLQAEDEQRRWVDAYWCFTFGIVFFAIHIGRMSVAWNLVGMISPLVAVLGDVATALLISFGLILPYRLAWRRATRPLERRGWQRLLARADEGRRPGPIGWIYGGWLRRRLRFARTMTRARRSPPAAVHWALQVGLPLTAVLIAVNPIWGFSWFFNSESWATEVWNRWAAARTDTWREQMIRAVRETYPTASVPDDRLFLVEPEGVSASTDFSFLVLGDTGEGDASQFCLKDRFLALGARPDVKFLVVSSDVIYPTGAMSDYEAKFYLPFKGFTKPVYAIPGNHDWYDALEGFAANFLEADAARAAIRARVVTDGRLTTTTDARIEAMVGEAARLRREFGVSTGWQRGPFFELHAPRFSLIAVDTGVLRDVDTGQWEWLKAALERAKGTFTMVILGHPLYAGGRYQGGGDEHRAGEWETQPGATDVTGLALGTAVEPFAAVHRLLREHQVEVVMAGDTHYFEHYRETYQAGGATRAMDHFVNGGGGAYMSIGTPLDWPRTPAVPDCAFFPRTDFLTAKLDRETPAWKAPLWLWVKRLGGWPFSAEALAGAFDYNRAPYLQSFVEVRVEGSANRVRLLLHAAGGPVRWREMQTVGAVVPAGKGGGDEVEFVIPMPARAP